MPCRSYRLRERLNRSTIARGGEYFDARRVMQASPQRMNEASPDLLIQKPFRAADLLKAISATLSAPGR